MTKTELDCIIALLDRCLSETALLETRYCEVDYQKRIGFLKGQLQAGKKFYEVMKHNSYSWR